MRSLTLCATVMAITWLATTNPSKGTSNTRQRPPDSEGVKNGTPGDRTERVSPCEEPSLPIRSSARKVNAPLSKDQRSYLASYGWSHRVGNGRGVWVSVDEQMLRIVENGYVIWEARCSTAKNGAGSAMGSFQTPLGWHSIAKKAGKNAPWGRIFRGGHPTRAVWKPGDDTSEDLVLTRILFLTGEEPGKNKGGNVDSLARRIYIHGTNAEEDIGTPVSHGCVRLRNDDIIEAFDLVPKGAPVLITQRSSPGRWDSRHTVTLGSSTSGDTAEQP